MSVERCLLLPSASPLGRGPGPSNASDLFSIMRLPVTWPVRPPRPHPSFLPRPHPRWLHIHIPRFFPRRFYTHLPWPLRHWRHIPRWSLIPPISCRLPIRRPIRAAHPLPRSSLPRPWRRLRPSKMALLTTPSSALRKVNTRQGDDLSTVTHTSFPPSSRSAAWHPATWPCQMRHTPHCRQGSARVCPRSWLSPRHIHTQPPQRTSFDHPAGGMDIV